MNSAREPKRIAPEPSIVRRRSAPNSTLGDARQNPLIPSSTTSTLSVFSTTPATATPLRTTNCSTSNGEKTRYKLTCRPVAFPPLPFRRRSVLSMKSSIIAFCNRSSRRNPVLSALLPSLRPATPRPAVRRAVSLAAMSTTRSATNSSVSFCSEAFPIPTSSPLSRSKPLGVNHLE